mgnify:CR=1 FL=1
MLIAALIVLLLFLYIRWFLRRPKFGKLPDGQQRERILASPNYRNGKFQNLSHTPALTEGATYLQVLREFFFGKKIDRTPETPIPVVKTNLHELPPDQDWLVWFGHSSYFIQLNGRKILVDPVFSPFASPIPLTTRAFKGTTVYNTDDIPDIDFLFITHDHWDHLDYDTLMKLKARVGKVFCGLGTGAHLECWGFDRERIFEGDWYDWFQPENDFIVHLTPARHFSGRGFTRDQTLWTSFVLKTPNFNIFLGGDSGYDRFFAEIGQKFGPFDLAILDNGQYGRNWKYIHMLPEEVAKAATDLGARNLLPVHSSKFALSQHPWYEPLERVCRACEAEGVNLLTPRIGEPLMLTGKKEGLEKWWAPFTATH